MHTHSFHCAALANPDVAVGQRGTMNGSGSGDVCVCVCVCALCAFVCVCE